MKSYILFFTLIMNTNFALANEMQSLKSIESDTVSILDDHNKETKEDLEAIKNQIKIMRGDLEQLQYEIAIVSDKLNKMNTDMEYRFNKADNEQKTNINEKIINNIENQLDYDPRAETSEQKINTTTGSQDKQNNDKPEESYQQAYSLLQNKNLKGAQEAFDKFIDNYPKHKLASSAYYWLGEIYMQAKEYDSAIVEYLKSYQAKKDGPRALDNLLKLAVALEKLGKEDKSCITLLKAQKDFPSASEVQKDRISTEIKRLMCNK